MKAKLISNIWKTLFICTTILISGSCTDDPFQSGNTDIEAGVKIFIKVPAPSVSQTRANTTSDVFYDGNGVYLLIFNGNDNSSKLVQSVRTSAGTDNTLYAKLKNNADAKHIYIVANVESYIKDWGENTTLGEIKEELKMSLPQTKDVLTAIVTPQPMIGYTCLEKGIQENASIGTELEPVLLTRSTAKISLYNQAENMVLEGANLINAPIAGYLYESPEKLAALSKAHSGKGGNIEEMLVATSGNEQNCVLYTYESDDTKSTALVIKTKYLGATNFYRINLNTKEAKYALTRNYNYIVTIKAVKKQGYSTAEEAINNPASNLEYDINVVDAYARDIVSNGQYYLGVSNTEFYALTDNSITSDEDICTISHNAPAGVVGQIEAPATTGGGIVLESTTLPDGTGMEQNITLRIKSLPTNFSKGEIKITLGDLTRTITVYKAGQPSEFGALLDNFVKKGFISGVVDAANQEWLKLTTISVESKLTEEAQYNRLEDSNEDIHIRVKANMGDDNSPKFRTGHIDLFRKDQIGNARVMIKQPVHDVYTDVQGKAKLSPYTYVGTFHRSGQTGERIIRVKSNMPTGSILRWKVRVLSGDFIRLSAKPSEDHGITRNFDGTGDNTTTFGEDIEHKYEVKDETTVIDNPPGATEIYFRVGLNSTIAPNATRYGILGLFVGDDIDKNKVTRYIFVRQGEAADYLMRPQDPAKKEPSNNSSSPSPSVIMDSRPLAVKLSPFNLTDKRDPTNSRSILPEGTQGTFADYPSQAGYLYQAETRKGWWADPSNPAILDRDEFQAGAIANAAWSNKYEICPEEYHRPIGEVSGNATDIVKRSPIRQSLWLYPKNGGVSNTQNSIIGYIADGFYDRQPMSTSKYADTKYIDQPTYVGKGAETAFIGVLTFNPHTLASIFMPMAGYYYEYEYKYSDGGFSGSFYTQSLNSNKVYYSVDYGFMHPADNPNGIVGFRMDNYSTHYRLQANNIRCVKN